MRPKVGIVYGTRPEVIKVAPIYFAGKGKDIEIKMICSGQHREMVDIMTDVFKIQNDYDLNIMTAGQTLNEILSRVVTRLEEILKKDKLDWILVQGDTTTAMAASLCAFNLGIKVGHIEAGLRSGNLYDPFPEEMNRRVISEVSELMFAPTKRAYENLKKEGFSEERILITGNTVIDAQKYICENFDLETIRKKYIDSSEYILVTLHRRENIGRRMENILRALKRFSIESGLKILFPVHKNPKVREIVYSVLGDCKNAVLIEPVDYITLTSFLQGCRFVATDSGGIQEEAPTFDKFVTVCRETTERPELIEAGLGVLAGTMEESVYNNLKLALEKKLENVVNPFGDGKAGQRIVEALINYSK